MRREKIFEEIDAERTYQREKWGDVVDDTQNTPWMWCAYIAHYATRWMAGTFIPLETDIVDLFRASMIKVATIAVAAVESVDRQRARGTRCYYESKS